MVNPDLIKGPWTKEVNPTNPNYNTTPQLIPFRFSSRLTKQEDDKVVELVSRYGPKKWTLIARQLRGRIGKQCRERWHNHLNPSIKKSAWTDEEDNIIYHAHQQWGNQWAKIAKLMPGEWSVMMVNGLDMCFYLLFLNEMLLVIKMQEKRLFHVHSSVICDFEIITIQTNFSQRTLSPVFVCFL